jgi:hypothetical protein
MSDTLKSAIRHILNAAGAFLIGKSLFGTAIDESMWQTIIGIIMAIISVVWSIKDKTANIESVQGVVRQVITFVGGLLVARGWLKAETLVTILSLALALIPIIQSWTARKKAQELSKKEITIGQLKK